MDGDFWELDASTPRTLEGSARAVPGKALPLGVSRGTRLSRPKQIDFMQRFMAAPFVPSFSNHLGLTLQRVFTVPFNDNCLFSILQLENVLIDAKGNIRISDFGLSALPQHIRGDGLLHTTCGSPNYVAPEILANKGYDGATSDIWSCGVILYVILTGYLPFDDRNLAVLYQKIFKGDAQIPKWLSSGARNMIRRILDPNPDTRITIAGIKDDEWFKQDYTPAVADDEEEDLYIDDEAFSMDEVASDGTRSPESPTIINAFQLIGMSSCLDLSGFFEEEDVSERKIRFTSNHSAKDLLARIQDIVTEMGFRVQMKNGRLKATQEHRGQKCHGSLSVAAEVFEISPSLYVVELRKSCGDSTVYRQLCKKISNDLGVPQGQGLVYTQA
ncbi:CBL-interacting serine/threonine-protein kinase 1 [Herrania umbratica]|uniref:non-specific serine/threonine protein kinase n=1 Tax=Herrania umbratica TaxID=108875 RepID=A0A6J1AV90_9ROSI|nr:CBL-interacting serine/threonine-protein kinase 1 [Herrania umbratica]